MRRLLVLLSLLIALPLISGCNAASDLLWDVGQGAEGLHARRDDFQAGTSRHPESYDEVAAELISCAENFSGRHILTDVDSLFRGGINLIDANYSHYVFSPTGQFRPYVEFGGSMWKYRMYVQHEMAHAMIHDFPFLRNSADSLGQQGSFDHHSEFFHACVHYNPDID